MGALLLPNKHGGEGGQAGQSDTSVSLSADGGGVSFSEEQGTSTGPIKVIFIIGNIKIS